MILFKHLAKIRSYLAEKKSGGKSIGFVPTMGALHRGHLSIIEKAKKETDLVVCSIFVNPTQFNNTEDLEKYPRDISKDTILLEESGCDVLFFPEIDEMYPNGLDERITLNLGELGNILEGKFRSGHFDGVATIVKKFFDIIQPNKAFFGEKDYQQLLVIKNLVDHFNYNIQIVPCAICREDDGLAMSSRNKLLSTAEREVAPFIYRTLIQVEEQAYRFSIPELKNFVIKEFKQNPYLRLEYFEIADSSNFSPVISWEESKKPIACIAAFLGSVRLIDNMKLFS
jgi:pantoate--beta-alanine ligase